ncbi:glycosyltransferase family 2 protein [Ornithinimicrobium sp. F0845]|uniref:glycosyltransferase family 2 protein n=1 Tax=Ornithinimicrobium sp. F0845 TaxID=2926412 RepID=UPI001FF25453|nr:glycosyltransferase family 2 protein [Ornithinimicrobium sp. F0845]MCK0110533.1 glycosyltransferase family 2 protein [Ornithinimicrobium sp. F0845]
MTSPTVSVVIPTYNRTDYLGTCLEHVLTQSVQSAEVVVVDASPGTETALLVETFPTVTYVRSPHGRGTTATSRAIGIERTSGDVVAFLDDDAYPRPDWLEQLISRYTDPTVAGVGGRTINGQPGEEFEGRDRVGKLLADGALTGYFAAMTDGDVEVDHLLGANMSMRRNVIEELGGIRDFYPGTCLREESDIALRARVAGYRLTYTPDAVVRHVGGTYAKGHRFDRRYEYYAARNHAVLLLTTLGLHDPRARANPRAAARKVAGHIGYAALSLASKPGGSRNRYRGAANGLSRAAVSLAGAVVGHAVALRLLHDLDRPSHNSGNAPASTKE